MEGKQLFAAFKKIYSDPEKTYQISIDMRNASERYAALSSSRDATWSEYSERAKRSVDALEIVGSSQMHPVIISALGYFSKREMERLLNLLEVIAVRFQLVERGRPGRIESLGGKAAKGIWDKEITTASAVFEVMHELYVPDNVFRQRFLTQSEKSGKKARYILRVIERQEVISEGKTFADELILGDVTLEHIFPKSPKAHWETEMKSDPRLASMINRLGNMCLLTDINHALGNKPWLDKTDTFKKSRLAITNQLNISSYPTWDSAAIDRRQGRMADLAVSAWCWK